MKKLIGMFLIALFGLSLIVNAQVDLKGFTLGKKYTGVKELKTTLGGIDGFINISTLNDNRIYMVIFMPSYNGVDHTRISKQDLSRLKDGMEYKYGIKFTKNKAEISDYQYSTLRDGVIYSISVDENSSMTYPCKVILGIISKRLANISSEEEKDQIITDF